MKKALLFIALVYSGNLFSQSTYNFHSYKLCKVDDNGKDYGCKSSGEIPPIESVVNDNQDSIIIKFGVRVKVAARKDHTVSQEWDDNNVIKNYPDGSYVYELTVPYTQPTGAEARILLTFNKDNSLQMLSYKTDEDGVAYDYLVYP